MVRIEGFRDFAAELEALADRYDNLQSERDGAKAAIADGITRAMDEAIVPKAKQRVPVDTGRLRDSIEHERLGWFGDTYRHKFGSTLDKEYPKVQEFGTRKTNYIIRPNGDYPLSFYWADAPAGMSNNVTFAYVTHPGVDVPQPGPMQSALKDNVSTVDGFVGQAVQERLDDEF